MKTILNLITVCIAITIMSSGCEYEYFEPVSIDETDTISFYTDLQPIFDATCITSGCHNSSGVPPNLESEYSYLSLVGGALVDTTDAQNSVLYQRVGVKKDMPPSSTLPSEDVQKILIWIKQGAYEN